MSSRECTSSAASMRSATLRYLPRGARLTDKFCSRELETVRTVQTAETPTGLLPTLLKRRAQHSLRDDGAGPSPPAVRSLPLSKHCENSSRCSHQAGRSP